MQGMRLHHLAIVHQSPQLFGTDRDGLRTNDVVERLGGRQMVRNRTDSAQTLHHHRHFPVRATFNEFLEAAKLDNV